MMRAVAVMSLLTISACATASGEADRGWVTLECMTASGGRFESCRILQEQPAGAGFGEAALRAAESARLDPSTVAGRTVRYRARFELAPDGAIRANPDGDAVRP
jgi:TonB family protein